MRVRKWGVEVCGTEWLCRCLPNIAVQMIADSQWHRHCFKHFPQSEHPQSPSLRLYPHLSYPCSVSLFLAGRAAPRRESALWAPELRDARARLILDLPGRRRRRRGALPLGLRARRPPHPGLLADGRPWHGRQVDPLLLPRVVPDAPLQRAGACVQTHHAHDVPRSPRLDVHSDLRVDFGAWRARRLRWGGGLALLALLPDRLPQTRGGGAQGVWIEKARGVALGTAQGQQAFDDLAKRGRARGLLATAVF